MAIASLAGRIKIDGKNLTRNEEKCLIKAMEVYTLLMMGQFKAVGEHFVNVFQDEENPMVLKAIVTNHEQCQDIFKRSRKFPDMYDLSWPKKTFQSNCVEQILKGNNFLSEHLYKHMQDNGLN